MGIFQFFLGLRNPTDRSDLEGIWERVGDNFAGCLIQVEWEEGELVGKIIAMNSEMLLYGWAVGDKKWRHIEGDAHNGWHLMDLRKQYDTASKKVLSIDYARYWMSIGLSGRLRLHQSKIPLFAAQFWKK